MSKELGILAASVEGVETLDCKEVWAQLNQSAAAGN